MLISERLRKSSYISLYQVIFGVLLIAAMAQIVIPIYPVPVTLQTVASILIGLLYKPREAILTWLVYLACGALGAPVFLNFTSGLAKFSGPTAGYLIGMATGAFAISFVRNHFQINLKKILNIFLIIMMGQVIIYTIGVAWLSHLIGFEKAIYSGLIVFIPSGIVKSLILSVIFRFIYDTET